MACLQRRQPPAWQTKVVHHEPGCLKAGSSCGGLGCRNVTSSKPAPVGRDVTEALQSTVSVVVLGVKHVIILVLLIASRATLQIVSIM